MAQERGKRDSIFVGAAFAIIVLSIVVSIYYLGVPTNPPVEGHTQQAIMMDTYVSITVYSNDRDRAMRAIDEALDRMAQIEKAASTFSEGAEAYRLNENGSLDNPSQDLLDMLELSIHYYNVTGGAFDITVEPLLDLWRYDPDADTQFWELDNATQRQRVNETLLLVGCCGLIIEDLPGDVPGSRTAGTPSDGDTGKRVRFAKPGMKITLGGIAKGYAVQEALETMEAWGMDNALINAGGDLTTKGVKPSGDKWVIGLENPEDSTDSIAKFQVEGQAVATSGNYYRYFDEEAEVGHIMDPKTGFSVWGLMSVTIIAPNATAADVLATAVFVLGTEVGMELVESLDGVECMIIDLDKNVFRSSGLSIYEIT